MSMIWWSGVVEDRNDPEKLGRCRVRIFGWHTDDIQLLPTNVLPWALPMQPITSAATSGVGTTPVGIVTGSWVVGFFLDGDEGQKPVIMGTIAGKPSASVEASIKKKQSQVLQGVLKDERGNVVVDEMGNPIQNIDQVVYERDSLKPLKSQDLAKLFDSLGNKLSSGSYSYVSSTGDLGKYQFSASTLIDLGYVKRPLGGIITNSILDDNTLWVNRDGIGSKNNFLSSDTIQESAMFEYTKANYNTLVRLGKIKETDEYPIVGGLLAVAHVMGPKNADKLDKKNAAGEKAEDYFVLGNSILGGNSKEFIRAYQEAGNFLPETSSLNNEDLAKIRGFQDPNKKYPKYEYLGLSDLNKLATGDRSHLSFQIKENKKIEKIPLARTEQTWDEPEPGYGGHYPYNQVIETEAGHVIEIDSTPNAERLHIFHKAGTYIEIDVNGSMVRKVVGENYEVMDRNNFVYVKGAQCLTVEGKTSILVKDDATIEVEGDVSVTGHGDTLVQSAGSVAVSSESAIITTKKGMDIVSEGTINMQGKDINFYAKDGAVTIKASKDLSLQSGRAYQISIKGGISLLLDALSIRSKMGATSIGALALSILKIPSKKTPNTTQIPVLQRKALNDDSFLFDSGETGSADYSASRVASGDISNNILLQATSSDLSSTRSFRSARSVVEVSEVGCEICNKFNNSFPRSFKISKNFTLGNMLVGKYGTALQAQRNLQEKDIVCNMIQLAENCLEPIRAKYPDLIISSGFRSGESSSDHNIGAAVDLVWPNRKLSEIKSIADWIVGNVPYRQVLLEYELYEGSNKIRVAWIHLAFLSKNGTLVQSTRAPVQTFVNHQSKYNTLVNLA